jgi:hypothetical protein
LFRAGFVSRPWAMSWLIVGMTPLRNHPNDLWPCQTVLPGMARSNAPPGLPIGCRPQPPRGRRRRRSFWSKKRRAPNEDSLKEGPFTSHPSSSQAPFTGWKGIIRPVFTENFTPSNVTAQSILIRLPLVPAKPVKRPQGAHDHAALPAPAGGSSRNLCPPGSSARQSRFP